MFGKEFQMTSRNAAFPTKTVRYNKLFPAREKTNLVTPMDRHKPLQVLQTNDSIQLNKEQKMQNIIYSNDSTNITFFMFPHAGFLDVLSQLGFDQNDGIINLMPIAAYCDDE